MRLFPVERRDQPQARQDGKASDRARSQSQYAPSAKSVDFTDGLSMEFDRWRFNLRASNTEPLVRLNVESRADPALLKAKTDELLRHLDSLG